MRLNGRVSSDTIPTMYGSLYLWEVGLVTPLKWCITLMVKISVIPKRVLKSGKIRYFYLFLLLFLFHPLGSIFCKQHLED